MKQKDILTESDYKWTPLIKNSKFKLQSKTHLRIVKHIYTLIASLAIVTFIQAENTTPAEKAKQATISQTGFYENKGQITDPANKPDPAVKFLLASPGFNVQLRQTGFSYDTYTDTYDNTKGATNGVAALTGKGQQPKNYIRHNHRVDIELVGCNTHAQLITEGKSAAYFNYLNVATPGGVTGVHYYSGVIYKNIYPHIDLEFTTSNGNKPVEYNFIVHDGGNPADIKLAYKGADNVNLKDNNLVVSVTAGDFSESIPFSYVESTKQPVKVTYTALGNNTFSFSVPQSQTPHSSDLVIDPTPTLTWGTYDGGTGSSYSQSVGLGDTPSTIAVDASGNVYVIGAVNSTTLIATTGAYQTAYGGSQDGFVAKFNSTGSTLVWATYYGGSGQDDASGLALDASDNVYITGYTTSATKIATSGAYQTALVGSSAVFVAEISSSGSALNWGTYFGGSSGGSEGYSSGTNVKVDASGNVYVIGYTESTSGIATAGAYQTSCAVTSNSTYAGFVAKFNPSLSGTSQLVWGTYFGNSSNAANLTVGFALALDASDNVYIGGYTSTTSGLSTAGVYQTAGKSANYSGYVAKFNPSLTGTAQLVWGTYYGGTGINLLTAIALDASDNVYVTGGTGAPANSGIATAGAYETAFVGSIEEPFVAKFTSGVLDWGTYYTANKQCLGYGIAVDPCDNVYFTGLTKGTTGVATTGAYQTALTGTENVFVAELNPTGTTLPWGTYYGGTLTDAAYGIALDGSGNIYITGSTTSTSGIATAGAYRSAITASGGVSDIFVAKFATVTASAITNVSCYGGNTGSASTTVSAGIETPYTYSWVPTGGSAATATGLTVGTYTVTVTNGCGISATATATITQLTALSTTAITTANVRCNGGNDGSASANPSNGASPYTYSWSNGTTTSATGTILSAGTYTVTVSDQCSNSATASVSITEPAAMSVLHDSVADNGNTTGVAAVTVSGGTSPYTYSWTTGGQTTDTIKGQSAGIYCCVITDNNGCTNTTCINIKSSTGIENISNSLSVNIYPDPNTGNFTIAGITQGQIIELYNYMGQKVLSAISYQLLANIDISDQANGIYLVRILNKDGTMAYEQKIVKTN